MKKRSVRTLLLFILALPFNAISQNKPFTYDQLFSGAYPENIFRRLPNILGWLDDMHYLQRNSSGVLESIDAMSGKASKYLGVAPESNRPAHSSPEFINPTASPDGRWMAYTKKDNNLYLLNAKSGEEKPLTSDGSDSILNGYSSWIYFEEILGRPTKYKAFWWSPDSKYIGFMRFDDSKVPVFPIYVPDGQHGYLENRHYPQPGDHNPTVKVGIAGIQDSSITWADFNSETDQYFGMPQWTEDAQLWIPWMNRDQDTLIQYAVDADGTKKQVYLEHQATWISLKDTDRLNFLPEGQGFIVKSDKDGWENLYLYDKNFRLVNQITKGNYWGTSILKIDLKQKQVYFTARKESTTRFDLYRTSFDGRSVKRLSRGNYDYRDAEVSPSGKYIIATYSSLTTPPVMVLINNNGKVIREIANSKTKDLDQYFVSKPVLKTVKSADGIFDLPMIIRYPLGFDSTKKYPILVSVYGGPKATAVFDRWTMPYGIAQWFSQEGVIQVSMDNRSSGHFGKKGLNYIYKQLGKWEIEDFMACGRWLRGQPWVDSSKIAITGGSFGGYMTCMALTYGADVFTHGIANSSVTDWQLYDSHYTERFMNTPQSNPQGYKNTSVLNYANKYRGLLRINHGTADDNVHFQNSLQLIDLLQDQGKHFEMMVYPGQRHGFHDEKLAHTSMETMKFVEKYLLGKN